MMDTITAGIAFLSGSLALAPILHLERVCYKKAPRQQRRSTCCPHTPATNWGSNLPLSLNPDKNVLHNHEFAATAPSLQALQSCALAVAVSHSQG